MTPSFVHDLAGQITDRSARGIAAAVGRMITGGTLAVGERLPTVRELASELGVSPTTVSEAWQSLAAVGAIDARGRQGTFVRQPTGPITPRRFRRVDGAACDIVCDGRLKAEVVGRVHGALLAPPPRMRRNNLA